MKAAGALLATGLALAVAVPASAQDTGLGAASQAGRVTLGAPEQHSFTDARAERSVRRAMRKHGFTGIDATCLRSSRNAKLANCSVSATKSVVWTGTATVKRSKRSYRVEYYVSG